PAVTLDGKIHHTAVDKPVLMGGRRFEGMRLGHSGWGVERLRAWNVRIDATVEGHDALDRAHREIVLAPETPDAKAAGIGMAFLEMIDFDHHRQPGLALRGVGGPALIFQTRRVVRLKTRNPRGDRGPRDVQKPADTALAPALRIERNHLPAGLSPRGIGVIVEQRQLPRGGGGQLMPELFDAMVAHPAGAGMKEDPGQFPVSKAIIES